jgi:hypothetical protein
MTDAEHEQFLRAFDSSDDDFEVADVEAEARASVTGRPKSKDSESKAKKALADKERVARIRDEDGEAAPLPAPRSIAELKQVDWKRSLRDCGLLTADGDDDENEVCESTVYIIEYLCIDESISIGVHDQGQAGQQPSSDGRHLFVAKLPLRFRHPPTRRRRRESKMDPRELHAARRPLWHPHGQRTRRNCRSHQTSKTPDDVCSS